MLRIYNSLTNTKEEFKPIHEGEVNIYSCGPTVYNFVHIGNFRSYITADVMVKTFKMLDYKVKWVINITDVDDKTIRGSKIKYPDMDPNEALTKFTMEYAGYFWADISLLSIDAPDEIPHATKYICQMQRLIVDILKKGYAYEKDGSVYFDVKKYSGSHRYGELVHIDASSFKIGQRTEADEYEKESIQDFVLWKGKKEGEPSWDFEIEAGLLGQTANGKMRVNLPGRPGWHIECSAMGLNILGVPFDIHTGGIDLKFPHHENEIAQYRAGCGFPGSPVNYWAHNEFTQVNNEKMSKSKNNFFTLHDIMEKGIKPLALRYLYLNTHYRVPVNFTWESVTAAQRALENLYDKFLSLPKPILFTGMFIRVHENYAKHFKEALSDDFNTPKALAVLWELIKDESIDIKEKRKTLLEFDEVLGLGLVNVTPEKMEQTTIVKKLLKRRAEARERNDFAESDRLRDEIKKEGFLVEDTEGGQRIKKL